MAHEHANRRKDHKGMASIREGKETRRYGGAIPQAMAMQNSAREENPKVW